MLISFSVENFRSYREKQTLSLLAEESDELIENTIPLEVAALKGRRVLRTAAIYGANASGKSNFIRALDHVTEIMGLSAKESTAGEELPVEPFRLDEQWTSRPSGFSSTFVLDGILYIYDVSMSARRVYSEELTAFPKTHPQRLFRRKVNEAGESEWHFSRTHFSRDAELEKRTRENSLFISVGALFNHALLTQIANFFRGIDVRQPKYAQLELSLASQKCIDEQAFNNWATHLLATADTGITGIRSAESKGSDPSEALKQRFWPTHGLSSVIARGFFQSPGIELAHQGTDNKLYWRPLESESDGTRQLLSLLRSWFHLLRESKIVFVDELDDSLHPLLSRQLLRLINAKENRASRGQLIFTTHDTSLLDPTLLRRDQIFFAEKSGEGATKLYSLLEYAPRRDESLQKGYLAGRYGAIPFLGDFKFETGKRKAADVEEAATSSSHGGKET